MRKRKTERQGLAAVELALMLPVMAVLLMLLVEGASAMHTYSAMVEASREGARHVLLEGSDANVDTLVAALIADIDSADISTDVTTDSVNKTVTVKVSYQYALFGNAGSTTPIGESNDNTFQFVAQTTMPMP
ncbi:TadE family protein [uncultured Pseudodesulfovibrio sp.]|uniref:TadE/TadG family type IV pilus assembly protein n=1 Tax=uncultured Pseudodesulfovibrio sp. TaxID=2035858 RepID=UPI0029C8CB3A|nr:TadE family protein [uncultured Pseudodesulfovibrio sp.]